MGTSLFLPPPGKLSAEDIQTPTPGWASPVDPAPDSPARGARVAAREWAGSLLMTKHLVAHTSRWMMVFHGSFLNLNKSAAVLALTRAQQDILFLTYRTRTAHRPRFARRRPPYGAAFTSAARALRYAMEHVDIQYIYMLSSAQCRVVGVSASHAFVSTTFTRALALAMEAGGGGDHSSRLARAVHARTGARSYDRLHVAHATLSHSTVNDVHTGSSGRKGPVSCVWHVGGV